MLKMVLSIVLPIIVVVVAISFNFINFFMVGPVTSQNLYITLGYWLSWILLLVFFLKGTKRGVLKGYSIFWFTTALTALFVAIVLTLEISGTWLIPFAMILLPQWYGIYYFFEEATVSLFVIAIISLAMYLIVYQSLKRKII